MSLTLRLESPASELDQVGLPRTSSTRRVVTCARCSSPPCSWWVRRWCSMAGGLHPARSCCWPSRWRCARTGSCCSPTRPEPRRRRGDLRRHGGLPRRRTLGGPAAGRTAGRTARRRALERAGVRAHGLQLGANHPRYRGRARCLRHRYRRWFGASAPALLGAAAVAVVPYVLAESVLGMTLDALLGERPAVALRHHLPLDATAIPFALLGAGAGLAALDVGWWSAGLLLLPALLLPAPLLPELLLVRVRRRVRPAPVRVVGGLLTLGAVLVALTFVLPGSEAWGRTVGLLAVVCFVGAECRVAVWPLPPAVGLVVVPAAMLVIPGPATVVVVLAVLVAAGLLMLATSRPDERALVVAVLRRRGLCGGRLGDGRARRCRRLLCWRRIGHRDRRCMGAGAVDEPGADPAGVAPVPHPPAGRAPARRVGRGRCRMVRGRRRRQRPDGMGPHFRRAAGDGGGDGGAGGALLAVCAETADGRRAGARHQRVPVRDRVRRARARRRHRVGAARDGCSWPRRRSLRGRWRPIARTPRATRQKSSTSPIESDQRSSVGSSVPVDVPNSHDRTAARGREPSPRPRVAGRCAGGSRLGSRTAIRRITPCSSDRPPSGSSTSQIVASVAGPRRRRWNTATPSSTAEPARTDAVAKRREPVPPAQVVTRAVGGQVTRVGELFEEARRRAGVTEHVRRFLAHGRLEWSQVGRSPGAEQGGQRFDAGRHHPHRRSPDDLPPDLQVAGEALVVRRVEHELDAEAGQRLERVEREPSEDAGTLEVGVGGGVDRPRAACLVRPSASVNRQRRNVRKPASRPSTEATHIGDRPNGPSRCFQRKNASSSSPSHCRVRRASSSTAGMSSSVAARISTTSSGSFKPRPTPRATTGTSAHPRGGTPSRGGPTGARPTSG